MLDCKSFLRHLLNQRYLYWMYEMQNCKCKVHVLSRPIRSFKKTVPNEMWWSCHSPGEGRAGIIYTLLDNTFITCVILYRLSAPFQVDFFFSVQASPSCEPVYNKSRASRNCSNQKHVTVWCQMDGENDGEEYNDTDPEGLEHGLSGILIITSLRNRSCLEPFLILLQHVYHNWCTIYNPSTQMIKKQVTSSYPCYSISHACLSSFWTAHLLICLFSLQLRITLQDGNMVHWLGNPSNCISSASMWLLSGLPLKQIHMPVCHFVLKEMS